MAFDAALVEERRDVFGISYSAGGRLLAYAADQAADRFSLGDGDWFSGQQLIEGRFQFGVLRLVFDIADAPLIVDAAAIADGAVAIEDENLGRSLGRELIGDFVL